MKIIFQIGTVSMCEMWVEPEKIADALKFIIAIYEPLIPNLDYCFSLRSDPDREQ